MTEKKPELRSCTPSQMQHATFAAQLATVFATEPQPNNLKAAALLVLQRNSAPNSHATEPETKRNFHTTGDGASRNTAIMNANEEASIHAWLAFIGERDTEIIDDVLGPCRAGGDALAYFLMRSDEVPKPVSDDDDDRRRCTQCTNLSPRGRCLAAQRGEIDRIPKFEPIPDMLQRCGAYAPGPNDADRRSGRERWRWQ